MYTIFLEIHSILRWVLLLILAIAIIKSFSSWFRNLAFQPVDNKITLFTLIFAHTQLIFGLILYFISPVVRQGLSDMGAAMKHAEIRFWTVEHLVGMVVAIALITMGRIASKKKAAPKAKHRTVAIYFTIALVVILYMIPWDRV